MTVKTEEDIKVGGATEPEIVATAVPADVKASGGKNSNETPIPEGHARFYCNKCHTPYDLPNKATSWRCPSCMEFNSITRGECEWCTIL